MSTHAPTKPDTKAHLHLLIADPPPLYYILDFRQTNQKDEQGQSTLSNRVLGVYGIPLATFSTPDYFKSRECELADESDIKIEVLLQTIEILNDNLPDGYTWSLLARELVKRHDPLGDNEVMRLILKRDGYFKSSSGPPYKGMLHCVLLPGREPKRERRGDTNCDSANASGATRLAAMEKVTSWLNITTHERTKDIKAVGASDPGTVSRRPRIFEIIWPELRVVLENSSVEEPEFTHSSEKPSWKSSNVVLTPRTGSTAGGSRSGETSLLRCTVESQTDKDTDSDWDSDASDIIPPSDTMSCDRKPSGFGKLAMKCRYCRAEVASQRNFYFYENICLAIGLCMFVYMVV
ncbi:hypothetical protein L211DRAFT_852332 [Terfezia boudieri ATCC MYA-4762]|uniref:Uncharacterized protein n=1 Tax=Terfezia boudieri ATCC MYA-4762 TaxID=1051890 RepID=A0A3N4LC92_9PEZI|nr:hypothetical protein L211DRAFT_852332 [Terfezia boudieri ATCC MYA-4762]